jgi:hypothetical protein
MRAVIHRYGRTGVSASDLAEAAYQLGTMLSRSPGFVAAIAVADGGDELVTIRLFEDQPSLTAAGVLAKHWMAEHQAAIGDCGTEVISGDVVAQKGL